MYDDPKCVRDNKVKVRLNDYELEELQTITALCRGQKSAVARDLLKLGIQAWHDQNSIHIEPEQRGLFDSRRIA